MAGYTLVIGNKNYSSWSLRPWLALKQTGARFEEVVIPLDMPETKASIARYSPTGRVPVLLHQGLALWESIAICEYLAEQFPDRGLWPADPRARAVARAVSAEMHAGFTALRQNHPMRVRSVDAPAPVKPEVEADLKRLSELWSDCRRRFGQGGPFLFGSFCIADAMFAPVVCRLRTYSLALTGAAGEYADAVWEHPHLQEWAAAARLEPWVEAAVEARFARK